MKTVCTQVRDILLFSFCNIDDQTLKATHQSWNAVPKVNHNLSSFLLGTGSCCVSFSIWKIFQFYLKVQEMFYFPFCLQHCVSSCVNTELLDHFILFEEKKKKGSERKLRPKDGDFTWRNSDSAPKPVKSLKDFCQSSVKQLCSGVFHVSHLFNFSKDVSSACQSLLSKQERWVVW